MTVLLFSDQLNFMRTYSAIFYSLDQYRHILADSQYEAEQILVDFTVDHLVEPIGVYNSVTNKFTYHSAKIAQMGVDNNAYNPFTKAQIYLGIKRLRKLEHS